MRFAHSSHWEKATRAPTATSAIAAPTIHAFQAAATSPVKPSAQGASARQRPSTALTTSIAVSSLLRVMMLLNMASLLVSLSLYLFGRCSVMLPSRGKQSWRHLRRRLRRRSHEALGGRSCHPDLTIGLIVLLNIILLQLQRRREGRPAPACR